MMSDDPPHPGADSDEELLRRGKDAVQTTSSNQAGRGDETETAGPMRRFSVHCAIAPSRTAGFGAVPSVLK